MKHGVRINEKVVWFDRPRQAGDGSHLLTSRRLASAMFNRLAETPNVSGQPIALTLIYHDGRCENVMRTRVIYPARAGHA